MQLRVASIQNTSVTQCNQKHIVEAKKKKLTYPLELAKKHLSVLRFFTTVFLGAMVCPVNETSSIIWLWF